MTAPAQPDHHGDAAHRHYSSSDPHAHAGVTGDAGRTVCIPLSGGTGRPWDQGHEPVSCPPPCCAGKRPLSGHLDALYDAIRTHTPIIAAVIHPEGDEPSHLRLTYRDTVAKVTLIEDETLFCWLTGPAPCEVIGPVTHPARAAVTVAQALGAPITDASSSEGNEGKSLMSHTPTESYPAPPATPT